MKTSLYQGQEKKKSFSYLWTLEAKTSLHTDADKSSKKFFLHTKENVLCIDWLS